MCVCADCMHIYTYIMYPMYINLHEKCTHAPIEYADLPVSIHLTNCIHTSLLDSISLASNGLICVLLLYHTNNNNNISRLTSFNKSAN